MSLHVPKPGDVVKVARSLRPDGTLSSQFVRVQVQRVVVRGRGKARERYGYWAEGVGVRDPETRYSFDFQMVIKEKQS